MRLNLDVILLIKHLDVLDGVIKFIYYFINSAVIDKSLLNDETKI